MHPLPKNPRRRDLVRLARECGWSIEPAGYEQLKATRPFYSCVPIPGHSDNERIPKGLAIAVAKQLLQPLQQQEAIAALQSQVATLEQQLAAVSQDRDRLALQQQRNEQLEQLLQAEQDQQALEELLLELEERNATLKYWFGKRTQKLRKQLQKVKRQAASTLRELRALHQRYQLINADFKLAVASLSQVEAEIERAAILQAQGDDAEQCLQQLLGRLRHILEIQESAE